MLVTVCCAVLQKRLQTAQVFGAKSTVRGQELGTASSVAFTPLQGLEIVNPLAAEKKQDVSPGQPALQPLCPSIPSTLLSQANEGYFSTMANFIRVKKT